MPRHGHHRERGHHHQHGASHDHGRHDPARRHHGRDAQRMTDVESAFGAETLAGPRRSVATQLLSPPRYASSSGLTTQSPAAAGCPKTGGSAQCTGECRACPERGLHV